MQLAGSPRRLSIEELASEARVGTVLEGKYRLARLIGVGPAASVYLAEHRKGVRAAIKVLHPREEVDEKELRRYFADVKLANLVDHPGVVRVLGQSASSAEPPFLVSELVAGESLRELLVREGLLAPARAVAIGLALLDVLAAAHERGIVHRGVHLGNVLLEKRARVRVGDFGLALPSEVEVTQGGGAKARASVAPEQARWPRGRLDATTDVWAAGATLFALLTGGNVRETSLADARPDLPSALASVVDRALRSEQANRWPSALAMKEALERARREAASPLGGQRQTASSGSSGQSSSG